MPRLRISDAPLLNSVIGDEKIPTGKYGDYTLTPDMLVSYAQGKLPFATKTELAQVKAQLEASINTVQTTLSAEISTLSTKVDSMESQVLGVSQDLALHKSDTNNPHKVTKEQVGLGNVDNTSDLNKPVSTATQAAIDAAKNEKKKASDVLDESGLNQQEINNGVESRDALRLINPKTVGFRVYLKSIHKDKNLGSGVFIATTKGSQVDNGGTVISSANPSMVWVRLREQNFVTVEDFGAVPYDDSYDDYDAFQNALDTNLEVRCRTARYIISKPLLMKSQQGLVGEGMGKTQIRKFSTTLANVDKTGMSGVMATVDYNLDAVIIVLPQASNYAKYVRIENICLQNGTDYTNGKGYGLFAPYISESNLKNILINYADNPFYTINSWMCEWNTIHLYNKGEGFIFGGKEGNQGRGGTSNKLSNCWVIGNKIGYPYNFYGCMYSSMSDCGADGNGSEGNHVDGIVFSERSTLSISSLGAENNYAKRIVRNVSSRINLDNLQVLNFYNTSGNTTSLFEVVGATARTIVDNGSLEFIRFANPTDLNSPKFGNASSGSLLRVTYCYIDQAMTGINNGTPFEIICDAASSCEFVTQSATLSNYGTQSTGLSTTRNITSNQDYIVRSIQSSDKILTSATNLYADVGFLSDSACRYNTAKFKLGNSGIFRDSFNRPRFKANGNPVDQYDGIPMDGLEVAVSNPAWVARAGHMYFNSTDNTIRVFTANGWMKVALILV